MLSKILSGAVIGINGYAVNVEVDISNGFPCFEIVGLPGSAVKESKERVRTAIKNAGLELPPKRFTVNLAPADTKKEGPAFDLPIALGVLSCLGKIEKSITDNCLVIGELSLDGGIKPVRGVLPIVYGAFKNGIRKCIVPPENADEASLVEGMSVYSYDNITDIIKGIKPEEHHVDINGTFSDENALPSYDFSDVRGQEFVKRAMEIAAAGYHNILTMCYIIMALENQYLYDFLRFHSLYTHLFSEYFLLNIPKSILFLKAKRKADLTQPSFYFLFI